MFFLKSKSAKWKANSFSKRFPDFISYKNNRYTMCVSLEYIYPTVRTMSVFEQRTVTLKTEFSFFNIGLYTKIEALLFFAQLGNKRRIHAYSMGISTKWNATVQSRLWTRVTEYKCMEMAICWPHRWDDLLYIIMFNSL